ncbi:MAG TPA: carboxylesterase family protein [Ramlibacter sp.]|nr:carboxylesterase family protein [Ramlibacter sp.]
MEREVLAQTAGGNLRGALSGGVFSFKGVPYGADTGGALRFQPPRPISWVGVRDAIAPGPRSPQNEAATQAPYITWLRDPTSAGEACLALNVFTASMSQSERRPVMVYLHGGAFVVGSGGAPGVDGGNLARRGVVVVTVNHRLNLFGHLYLGDADAGRYADAGNAGMLDLVAALEWVRDNIAGFGGDPGNVTIFGQSGGGSKVGALMAMPCARGLFHKAIIQSASSVLALATLEEAERNTDHFLAQLGLDRTRLRALCEMPAETLLRAMPAAIRAAGGVDNFRPVVDGRTLFSQPFDAAAVRLSADIPLMTGWCENEQRLTFASMPQVYRRSFTEALASTALALGVTPDEAEPLMQVYRAGRPQDAPGDVYAQIFGDHRYRRTVTAVAQARLTHGGAPPYVYLLDWKSPAHEGLLRTPHTLCLAFAFANTQLASGITGDGTERLVPQEQMADAWVAFARSGNPNHAGLPAWQAYALQDRPTMVFGREPRLQADPLRAERLALERYPRYLPAIGEGRLR